MTTRLARRRLPAFPLVTFLALALLGLAVVAPVARAEPYFAVREGFRCNQCHLNPTGGGKRTPFGLIFERTGNAARLWDWKAAATDAGFGTDWTGADKLLEGGNFLDPSLTDRISLGGEFRTRGNLTFNAPGADLLDFAVNDARLYLQTDLHPQYLTFYIDETVHPTTTAREVWGLVHNLPANLYVKAGRLLPPFGWRLQDNNAFVRQVTGINYNTPDNGVEIGTIQGPGMVSLTVTNGNGGGAETERRKQIIGWTHWVWRRVQVGASILGNEVSGARRLAYGAFGGVNYGRFTFLAEADAVRDEDTTANTIQRQLVTFTEMDVRLRKGLNLKGQFGYNDPDRAIGANARTRARVGLEFFPSEGIQVSLFWVGQDGIPQKPTDRVDSIFLELHLFL